MEYYLTFKHSILFVYFFCISQTLCAQIGYQLVGGAQSLGMGGASVMQQNAESILHNPAGLVGVTRTSALLTSEIRFGLRDLKPICLAFVKPTSSGVLGFTFQNYAFEVYRESKVGVAYARRLSAKFNVGVQLSYERLKIDKYGSTGFVNFEIGCNSLIFNDLVLSAYVFNPISMKINETESTPSVFRLGLGYTLNSKVLVCLETEKDRDFPASFKFGLAYKIIESCTVRCGFRTSPTIISFGFGYAVGKNLTADFALSNHPYLGATPALGLNYAFGKEGKSSSL